MSITDRIFGDKQGADLMFSAGVEVGRAKGREELAQHLIRSIKTGNEESAKAFRSAVMDVIVKFQRGEL